MMKTREASKIRKKVAWAITWLIGSWFTVVLLSGCGQQAPEPTARPHSVVRPAMTVALTVANMEQWPQTIAANGTVMAWQEAVIGAEVSGERLVDVAVQVGDKVKKGAVLARLDDQAITQELNQAQAAVLEQEAAQLEAEANAQRAKALQAKGFYSAQMATQYLAAEQMAEARLASAKARRDAAQLRLDRTQIRSPDDGEIAARTATVGSLTQPGQELFRLIRQGRLEWRAEVSGAEIGTLKAGVPLEVLSPSGELAQGKVRAISPALETTNRNGLVYVDLPKSTGSTGFKAGMFVRGQFMLNKTPAMVVPQSALVMRDGFAYLFRVEGGLNGDQARLAQIKVETGRRQGEMVEITHGLAADAQVVARGAGFLADGDTVKVAP